jgi:hypothetical protein
MVMRRKLVALILTLLVALPVLGQRRSEVDEIVPELAGAERLSGSPESEDLSSPYLHYIVIPGPRQTQTLSIYDSGIVILRTRLGERESTKHLRFPPDAIETYRKWINAAVLETVRTRQPRITPTSIRETIRIYDLEGSTVERVFDPSMHLPTELEKMRALLQDLARIISEDNEMTSPMIDYEARKGDVLLDQQMEEWVVLSVLHDQIELRHGTGPLRVWVKREQLDEKFASWFRPDPE